MAILALHSAATGLSALSTALDVISNNLANTNTTGYKSSRANFQDLLYIERAQPGARNANGDERPTGLYLGLGTKVSGTQLKFQQGSAIATGNDLDLMIMGDGFFKVQVANDVGEGFAYTRAGNFTLNSQGQIVLATDQGRILQPEITVPEDAQDLSISEDGTVSATLAGSTTAEEIGAIELTMFVNPAGLKQIGENLFLPTAASGDPADGIPTEGGRGSLQQEFLEGSNVDPVIELVSLITTQRGFELNSQSIQAADEALRTVTNLRRF